jgi:Ser/Thr protein kinase RdoA (MazF antagonist)
MAILNAENQINITKQLLVDILLDFGIELNKFSKTKYGIANQNLFITSKDSVKYVLKILRNSKTTKSLDLELNFIAFLKQNNLPVIDFLQTKLNTNYTTFKLKTRNGSQFLCIRLLALIQNGIIMTKVCYKT